MDEYNGNRHIFYFCVIMLNSGENEYFLWYVNRAKPFGILLF